MKKESLMQVSRCRKEFDDATRHALADTLARDILPKMAKELDLATQKEDVARKLIISARTQCLLAGMAMLRQETAREEVKDAFLETLPCVFGEEELADMRAFWRNVYNGSPAAWRWVEQQQ